jgi:hypothetical protein
MTSDQDLRDKLRKIEALFAGASTPGEKAAAGAAAERLRARLREAVESERIEEFKFSLSDPWARQLFVALCRRYGLKPFRYRRMHRQTVLLNGPPSFIDGVLWPEFQQLNDVLSSYLAEITDRLIREEVHGETGEADEVPDTLRIGR